LREIDGVKLHTGFHRVRNERHIAGEPMTAMKSANLLTLRRYRAAAAETPPVAGITPWQSAGHD
jgi:hypothetical protein